LAQQTLFPAHRLTPF